MREGGVKAGSWQGGTLDDLAASPLTWPPQVPRLTSTNLVLLLVSRGTCGGQGGAHQAWYQAAPLKP